MLDELMRVGAIKQLKDGRICLLSRAYVPEKGPVQKLAILGMDTADLIATIEHNLYAQPRNPRFQRKVMYDNVSEQTAKVFHSIAAAPGQELLEALDRWLVHRDRDVNPRPQRERDEYAWGWACITSKNRSARPVWESK